MIDLAASLEAIRNASSLEQANDALRVVQLAVAKREATMNDWLKAHDVWAQKWQVMEQERMKRLPDCQYSRGNYTGD